MLEATPVADLRLERRWKPRINKSFPAKVRGINSAGESFEVASLLDNVSATGLYMRLLQNVECGTKLFVAFQFTPAAVVAIKGPVVRVEMLPNGALGIAVKIVHRHFIYQNDQAMS